MIGSALLVLPLDTNWRYIDGVVFRRKVANVARCSRNRVVGMGVASVKIRVFQKGFNFAQDGPGNRLVYHLQGCNMRCSWCANPEGMAPRGSLMVKRELLVDTLCPHGAIRGGQLDRDRCAACATRECLQAQRNQAIRLSCGEYQVEALVEEAQRSSPMFFSGGGVTLTGGEPTLQFRALRQLLTRLKAAGIHTAVETNATHARLPELLPLIDYPIVDCKHYADAALKAATGVGLRLIARNFERVLSAGQPTLIRIPLIGGFNDSARDCDGFIGFLSTFPMACARVEFLRFHEFGRSKWGTCGLEYRCAGQAVTAATVTHFSAAFAAHGLHTVHT